MVLPPHAARALALLSAPSGSAPRLFFAPGRANLLGAHLDYNGGCVMPVGLSKGTWLALRLRADGLLRLRSEQFPGEEIEVPLVGLRPGRTRRWSAYCEGAIYTATRAWGSLPGLEVAVCADLPMARGLSSSASIECAMVYALSRVLEVESDEDEMIRLAHQAENRYVGVRCGILDQAAILLAEKDSLLHFDCLELTREHLPLPASRARIAVIDSGVRRELAGSAFNQRVAECTRALALLQEVLPGVTCLRDVRRAEFEAHRGLLDPTLVRRVEHVVGEVERTELGARALRRGDLPAFGAAITAAHHSLRDLYEVSTPELDALVEGAVAAPGCLGARLTGAGFGGCIVALVVPGAEEDFAAHVLADYRTACGRETEVQWFAPAGGPREVPIP